MGKFFIWEKMDEKTNFVDVWLKGGKEKRLVKPKYFFSVKSYDKISTIFLI